MSDTKRTPKRNDRYCDPQCPYLVTKPLQRVYCVRRGPLVPESFDRFLLDPACAAECPSVLVTEVVAGCTGCGEWHQVQVSLDNGWHTRCEIPFGATAELAAQRLRQLADRVEAIGRPGGLVLHQCPSSVGALEDFS